MSLREPTDWDTPPQARCSPARWAPHATSRLRRWRRDGGLVLAYLAEIEAPAHW